MAPRIRRAPADRLGPPARGRERLCTRRGNGCPAETEEAFRTHLVGIKGPLTTPVGGGIRSLNVALRQKLDLYVCLRPVRWFPGVPSPVVHPERVDMVVFRENTEDVYAGLEVKEGTPEARGCSPLLEQSFGWRIRPDAGIGIKPVSRMGSERLVRAALTYALARGRKSVTLVHKGNIQKFTEGAFREWGYALAKREFGDRVRTAEEPEREGALLVKDAIADNFLQQALTRPSEFDVIATTNLNGDYISDALAAQVGGIGIAPGATSTTRPGTPSSRPRTGQRRNTRGRTWQTPAPSSCPARSCWTTWAGRKRRHRSRQR